MLTNQILLNITSFGDEPSPLHVGFQAAFEAWQMFQPACAAKLHTLHALPSCTHFSGCLCLPNKGSLKTIIRASIFLC
ncbi:hypothetical protein [Kingella oralis]|uniref:hypothetical protein n=1 Tax=Kingella oralis TaxID=505 RepID=UPI0034E5152D